MPYRTVDLTRIYHDLPDAPEGQKIDTALNKAEAKGWRLVGVIPPHQRWDEEGEVEGWNSPILLLHKEP